MSPDSDLHLDYCFDSAWNRAGNCADADLSSADDLQLRYDLFLGDILLLAGGRDFSARWGWVPILDFAVALSLAIAELRNSGHSWVDFTENDALLRLRSEGDRVVISATYAEGTATPTLNAFLQAIRAMNARLVSDLETSYPSLTRSSAYQGLRLKLLT